MKITIKQIVIGIILINILCGVLILGKRGTRPVNTTYIKEITVDNTTIAFFYNKDTNKVIACSNTTFFYTFYDLDYIYSKKGLDKFVTRVVDSVKEQNQLERIILNNP